MSRTLHVEAVGGRVNGARRLRVVVGRSGPQGPAGGGGGGGASLSDAVPLALGTAAAGTAAEASRADHRHAMPSATDVGAAPSSRQVATSGGLTGGGNLTADRTLSIAAGGVGTAQLADGAVTSAKIATETIVDSDISSLAEISTAKINGLDGQLAAIEAIAVAATAGPASSVDGRVALFNGTTGKSLRQSAAALAAIATSGSATDLTTGTVATARLGSGAANSGTFLRGDGTWAAAAAASPIIGGQGAGTQLNEPASATSLLTSTITVPVCAAGDLLMFDAAVSMIQNSGASRNVSFTVRLGATSIVVATPSVTASSSTRSAYITGFIRVHSTTTQTGSANVAIGVTSGGAGTVAPAHGVATENLASTSTFDLLVTATANTTQNFTLQSLSLRRIAA